MRLLARRQHFVLELERKLASRGYDAGEIAAAVERLTELRYLDDRSAAAEYVRHGRERRRWGRTKLRAELARRGVDAEIVHDVLSEIDDDDERRLALAVAATSTGDRDALARRLARRGFAPGVIVAVLEERDAEAWRS